LNFNPGGGIGSTTGDAYGRRPALMPQDLRNIPPGQGYIWLAGLNDPIPAIFPPLPGEDKTTLRYQQKPHHAPEQENKSPGLRRNGKPPMQPPPAFPR
jgi:hypothetical protein